jgi:hypothetical protein
MGRGERLQEDDMWDYETLTHETWRGYQCDTFPAGSWVCEDGVLRTVAEAEHIDLITRQQYRYFELALEWRVASGGNSGILYRVSEATPYAWQSGPEMQLLDNDRHPDGQTPETSAGALYGLIAPRRTVLRPIGDFNTARLVVCDTHVEHWLNGVLVVAYELRGAAFTALVGHSKFQHLPGFAAAERGHIVLQHHGNVVWFRHLRLRPLPDEGGC